MFIRKEDFDKVQERLRGEQAFDPEGARLRSLMGLVRCSSCGSYIVVKSVRGGGGGRRYYCCRNAWGTSSEAPCGEEVIRADVLEDFVRRMVSVPSLEDEVDGGPLGGSS